MVVSEQAQGRVKHINLRCDGCDKSQDFTFRIDKPFLHALREAQWYTEGTKHFCDGCIAHVKD